MDRSYSILLLIAGVGGIFFLIGLTLAALGLVARRKAELEAGIPGGSGLLIVGIVLGVVGLLACCLGSVGVFVVG